MYRNPLALAAILVLQAAAFDAGAICAAGNAGTSLDESTPDSALVDHGDGTVTHTLTGQIGVPRWLALRQKSAEAFGFLGETLHGTEDIRANGAVGYILVRFDEILRAWFPLRRKAMVAISMIWTTTLLLITIFPFFDDFVCIYSDSIS